MRLLINKISKNLEIVAEISSVYQALAMLPNLNFDVILLDIELIDGTGFDILKSMPNLGVKVIFTTAFDDHAINAFKANAVDYLLKPINIADLERALLKCNSNSLIEYEYIELLAKLKMDLEETRIAVKGAHEIHFFNTKKIDFVQADGSYCKIFLVDGKCITSTKTLKHYENQLIDKNFFKINRKELINVNRITSYKKTVGYGLVVMHNGDKLSVSRRRRTEFNSLLKEIG